VFLEVTVTKKVETTELMILLAFLPPTLVMAKLFYQRAATPIIEIIPLFLR